ncbi:MAG TPA: response regulator [Nitrososphaera sp.]|nr:response regulator [Nitrososphaera sp.]
MVVDDERDVLDVTEMSIEQCGYHVESFSDPRAALQRFKQSPEEFSLVLSDIRMPVLDGIAFSQELLKIKSNVKILLMTAFDIDAYIFNKLPTIRKEDVVRKPFLLQDLCKTVNQRLKR